MRAKSTTVQTRGGITSGIQKETLILKTIEYVSRQLPEWRDDPDRTAEESENQLNLQLVKFLDAHARSEFPMVRFDHEEYQSGRRTVDISASPTKTVTIDAKLHTIYNPILVIEGKRLPAPSPDREKEYVSGGKDNISGGIQRFKLGLHGSNHNTVAIVGYVQERSLSQWYTQINNWITKFERGIFEDSCDWSAGEQLNMIDEDIVYGVAKYKSIHSRVGSLKNKRIELHHLWIVMHTNKIKKRRSA